MSTSELVIRPAVVGDVPALRDIYNHYVATSPATFDVEPVSMKERLAWFHRHAETGPHRLMVAVRAGQVLGFASSHTFQEKAAYASSVGLSVYVHHAAHGQGIGKRLYTALLETIAGENLHRAYAGVTQPNPASVALHLSVGFHVVGTYDEVGFKFGRYWSLQLFEKHLS